MSLWPPTPKTRLLLAPLALVAGCASNPVPTDDLPSARTVCDNYIILSMCVQDLVGDGTVDMVYFTDTREIFMYQQGRKEIVAQEMPFHRCAVPLNAGMQDTTNQILNRENMSLTEELAITRQLITSYRQAKPEIDACNARFEQEQSQDGEQPEEFYTGDSDWDEE